MSSIPFVVMLLEIIARLPPLLVTQLKTVSKEWYEYISTPIFSRAHCDFMRSSPDQKILTVGYSNLCLARSLNARDAKYLLPNNVQTPVQVRPKSFLFLASLDGMLCASIKTTWDLLVWNPLSGACRKLSTSLNQGFFKERCDAVGFYVDSSFEYKILHVKRRCDNLSMYVYSFRLGSWKSVTFLKNRPYHGSTYNWSLGTFCGDGLYNLVSQCWLAGHRMIVRFDMNTHEFSEFSNLVPLTLGPQGALVNIRNVLHMYIASGCYVRHLELWKLHNQDWVRLVSIPESVFLQLPSITSMTYVNITGSTICIINCGDVVEIDLRDYVATHFHFETFAGIIHGTVYTETLMSP